jgi:hypothetical protein
VAQIGRAAFLRTLAHRTHDLTEERIEEAIQAGDLLPEDAR